MDEERRAERYGFEAFDCAPALRLEANERVAALQFAQVEKRLERIEAMIAGLERRLWMAVYGVVAVILTQAVQGILEFAPR